MENLTAEEFLKELEKSNTTIKDLLMDNFEWIESAEATGGAFFGYSVLLFTDNLKFCLSDRTFRDFAVVKGYMIADSGRREFEFFIDGYLRRELWDCAMIYLGRCDMYGKLDNQKLSKSCLFPYRKGGVVSNDWLENLILVTVGEIRNVMEEIAENWNNKNNNKETFEQLFRENKKLDFKSSSKGRLDGYTLEIRSIPEIKIDKESKDAETFIVYDGTYCEFHEKLNSAASEWLWEKVLKLWEKDKRRERR